MGLLKDIANVYKGAVKGVVKTVTDPNVIMAVATGNYVAAGQKALGNAAQGIASTTAKPVSGKNVAPVVSPVSGKPLLFGGSKNAASASRSGIVSTGNDQIDAVINGAIGGAAVGAGTAIIGTDAGNSVVNATGWAAVKQWFSKNATWVIVGGLAVGAAVWAIFFRKKGRGRSPRKVYK